MARSGNNYLSALRKLKANLWRGGEQIADPTVHPALMQCARSLASLYDMQLEHPAALTYRTDDGGRSGLSFIQPHSVEEVRRRTQMFRRWAEYCAGMMTRTPDLPNTGLAAMAAARDYFAAGDPRWGANIANYYTAARRNDWCIALALAPTSRGDAPAGPNGALRVVEQSANGIDVEGALPGVVLAPFAEELLVVPPRWNESDPATQPFATQPFATQPFAMQPFALMFAINCNAAGLTIICGEPLAHGQTRFAAPLAARFDEIDSTVIFDHVRVPPERVFLCSDALRGDGLYRETGAAANLMHQAVVRNLVKSEFMLGLAARLAETRGVAQRSPIKRRLGELIALKEILGACLQAAEAGATAGRWGIHLPAVAPLESALILFARSYPRLCETIQIAAGPELTTAPAEADLEGPLLAALERHFNLAAGSARERAALARIAGDLAGSFGQRQMLREEALFAPDANAHALAEQADLALLTKRLEPLLRPIG